MPKPSLETTLRKLLAARDKGKRAYAEADKHLTEALSTMKPGQRVDLGAGQTAELVDNFAVKNVVWKPAGVRRFDIEVSHA